MRRALLQARRELQNLVLGVTLGRMHAGNTRRTQRKRAGLVDDERIDPLRPLERRGILDEDAGLRAETHADHQRRRRRKAQRARASDHQHCGRAHQRRRPIAGEKPVRGESQHRDREHRRHETRGHAIGQPLHGRLRSLRRGDLADDRREQRRRADGRCLAAQRARFVDRAGEHRVAALLWRRARSRRSASPRSPTIRPESTRPSTATLSPARTTKTSPTRTEASGTSRVSPSRSHSTVAGCKRKRSRIACAVRARARRSSSLPSSTRVITTAAASK